MDPQLQQLRCPCCEKGFSGKTAQARLNSHCKAIHFIYYRQHIRPLKDPKLVNHDAYIRQKQKDPTKVQKDRLMARMRKKALKEQISRITLQGVHIEAPYAPGNTDIDPTNPFYTIEFTLRIFIGPTLKELVSFDVIPTLEGALASLVDEQSCASSPQRTTFETTGLPEPGSGEDQSITTRLSLQRVQARPLDLRSKIMGALAVARSAELLHPLALTYYKYRQAIHDSEFYEERLQHYLLTQEGRSLNPEQHVDHDLIKKRAAELAAGYRPKPRSTSGTTAMNKSTLPPDEDEDEDEEDGEYEEEQEYQSLRVRPDVKLPEVIPDSDREHSPEL